METTLAHPFSNRPEFRGLDQRLFGFGKGQPLGNSEDQTLMHFCKQFRPKEDGSSVWSTYAAMQGGTFETLAFGSRDERNAIYRRLYATPITHGFAQGPAVFESLSSNDAARLHVGSIVTDRLFRLAEAVGVVTVKSAEHGQNTIEVDRLDELMESLERNIGFPLTPPVQAGELFGLQLARGTYSERHFDAIYAAWRARRILEERNEELNTVVDIGGGAGHLAFYLKMAGFKKVSIVDLPQALVAQYILITTAFGAERVSLNENIDREVNLVTVRQDQSRLFRDSQLIINIDSMPEMALGDAMNYLLQIPAKSLFLSINQESGVPNGEMSQNVVSSLAKSANLDRLYRYPAWLRTGYVEELFQRAYA